MSELDPTITLGALLVFVPATIGAIAALKGAKAAKHTRLEVTSPNGTTTAQVVHDIKAAVTTIASNQILHDAADIARFKTVNDRLDEQATELAERLTTERAERLAEAADIKLALANAQGV